MQDFTFCSPTKLIVGKDSELAVGKSVKEFGGTKVLVHHSGGHVVKSGLLDRVTNSLREEGIPYVELGGVVPNPRLELVHEGIELCRREKVDFILAVGGGSVIDSSKAIAMGIPYEKDVWEFFIEDDGIVHDVPVKSTPIGVVLTIAATGSEASNSCVITKEDEKLKRFCDNDINRPRFAIENPELTMSLPKFQTACSIVDIMSHSFERYFTPEKELNVLSDRLAEAIFHTCIECAAILMKDPHNYQARANLMVASSLSHNGLTGIGRTGDWSSHFIEHELSGEYDVTHGAGLAVITPAWMKYTWKNNPALFINWAVRVMGVDPAGKDEEAIVLEAVAAFEDFCHSLELPTKLSEMPQIQEEVTEDVMWRMAKRVRITNSDGTVGGLMHLTAQDIVNIFKLAL